MPENGRSFRKGVYGSKAGKEEAGLTGRGMILQFLCT